MALSEETVLELTAMIMDVLNLEKVKQNESLFDIKDAALGSSLYGGILVTRGFLNIDNPYIFTFNNEHDNDLFKTFLLTCMLDYIIHKLSFPEIAFDLSDSKETNYKKILDVHVDPAQLIVLILTRIQNGQHFKCLSSDERYYSITEADNYTVCTGVLKEIFNSISIQEELLTVTDTTVKEDFKKYQSHTTSQQFHIVCKVIDNSGILGNDKLHFLMKEASKDKHSPAGYLFGKLYTKFLSIRSQYSSPTVHKITVLFEYYNNIDAVNFDEKTNTYIWTEKFINAAKEIIENIRAEDNAKMKNLAKMHEIEANFLSFLSDTPTTIQ